MAEVPAKFLLMVITIGSSAVIFTQGEVSSSVSEKLEGVNKEGPFVGIVVPNSFEMRPLLQSSSFAKYEYLPYLDISGRRFRFGTLENKKVIVVMTGLSMVKLNAGITTQMLVTLFNVEGVLHYGVAGNANPNLGIGDVAIPRYWAHSGLWNWQRFGDGPSQELSLESSGDYTRKIGYLNISSFNVNPTKDGNVQENLLNSVWYQPEEVFPVDGTPERRQHAFWVHVDDHYLQLSQKLKGLKLEQCVNSTTCLPRAPAVVTVDRAVSASIFLDNSAYRKFLYAKFNATTVDMESAAVSLICLEQRVPFIVFRSLSDLAGGGSALSNEASEFASLASKNAVLVLIKFVSLL